MLEHTLTSYAPSLKLLAGVQISLQMPRRYSILSIFSCFRSKSRVHLSFVASVPSWKFPKQTKSITEASLCNIPG